MNETVKSFKLAKMNHKILRTFVKCQSVALVERYLKANGVKYARQRSRKFLAKCKQHLAEHPNPIKFGTLNGKQCVYGTFIYGADIERHIIFLGIGG